MKEFPEIIFKLLHGIFAIVLLIIVVAVVYIDLDIDGVRVIHHSLGESHIMVSGPSPELRVNNVRPFIQDPYWGVYIDPVYFDLVLPRKYNTVDVVLKYKADGIPLIQLGAQTSRDGWNFAWNGVQNLPFEEIEWPCLHDVEREWWLCQKQENYSSIENFLLAPPANSKILNYNFPLPEGFSRLKVTGYNHLIDLEEFDYLIAKYTSPTFGDDWMYSTASYSIDSLYQEGRKLHFVISAPGINDRGQIMQINSIEFILRKDPINKSNIGEKIISALRRIF